MNDPPERSTQPLYRTRRSGVVVNQTSLFSHQRYGYEWSSGEETAASGAGSTLNGFGTGKDDLKKQVDKTLADAQRGAFLPDDYKFGATDNNLVSSFGATLNSTSTKLATAAR